MPTSSLGCHGDKSKGCLRKHLKKSRKPVLNYNSTSLHFTDDETVCVRLSSFELSGQALRAQHLCLLWISPMLCLTPLNPLFSRLLIFPRWRQAQTPSLGEARKNKAVYIAAQMTGKSFCPAPLKSNSEQNLRNPKS